MSRDSRVGEAEGGKSVTGAALMAASVVRIVETDLAATLGLPSELPSTSLHTTSSTPSILVPCYGASLVSAVLAARAAAAEWQPQADLAATRIQSTFRMYIARRAFLHIRDSITTIQRCYRGHAQRRQYSITLQNVAAAHAMSVFHYYATRIQACYRGFHSRRTRYNYYALRAYMADIGAKSAAVREMATQSNAELQLQLTAAKHTAEMTEFAQAASKLHFMLSTDTMPGVYRRPQQPSGTTTNWGSKVEEDIRQNAKTVRRLARKAASSRAKAHEDDVNEADTHAEQKMDEEEGFEVEQQPAGEMSATERKLLRGSRNSNKTKKNTMGSSGTVQQGSQRAHTKASTKDDELRLPHIHAAKVPPLPMNKSCQWESEEAVPALRSLKPTQHKSKHATTTHIQAATSDDATRVVMNDDEEAGKNATWPLKKKKGYNGSIVANNTTTTTTTSSFHRGFCVPSHDCGVSVASGPDMREVAALQRSVDAKLIAMVHGNAPFKVPKAAKLM